MKENIKISSESFPIESKVIDWMRFPLAVLVVYVHTPRQADNLVEWIWSDAIASMAVPLFFVLSGFLYFLNVGDVNKPQAWYGKKTLSRIKSIAIPYVFWALLPVLVFCIRKIVGMVIHMHGPGLLIEGLTGINFYELLWDSGNGMPQYMQLWFLRDLFVLFLFTPIIGLFVKYAKYSSLPILLAANILNIWIPIPGFSASGTLFFAMGAWCAIHKVSMFKSCKYAFYPSMALALITMVLLRLHYIPLVVFNVCAVPLYMYGMWLIFSKESIKPMPIQTSSTMFIYVAHGYIVENKHVWAMVHNVLPDNMCGELLGYFTIPLLAIIVLVAFHWILSKIAPKTMQIICGR